MKKYPFFAALVLFSQALFAQVTFERVIDLPGNDWGTHIVRDPNTGNYAVASTYYNTDWGGDYGLILVDTCGKVNNFIPFGTGHADNTSNLLIDEEKYVMYGNSTPYFFGYDGGAYLIAIDPSFNNYFTTMTGGIRYTDQGSFVILREEGDSAVYLGFGSTVNHGVTSRDLYLIKYTMDGIVPTGYIISTEATEHGYCVQNTSDGGIIMLGTTDYRDDGWRGKDIYVVKFDSNYTMEWNRIIGTNENLDEVGYSILERNNPGDIEYMITGYRERADSTSDTTYVSRDVLVMKLNDKGFPLWAISYGGNEDEEGKQIIEYESGYAIAGYTEGFGAGSKDALIMSVSGGGQLNWGYTYGDEKDNYANSLVLSWEQNGFMVVGGSDTSNSPATSHLNTYLFRTNISGLEPCRTDTFGGLHEIEVVVDSAGEVDTAGGYWRLGGFMEYGLYENLLCDYCTDSLTGPGRSESKMGSSGMQTDDMPGLSTMVYPNPTTGELYIPLDKMSGDIVEISILSPAGLVVFRQKLGDNEVASTKVVKLPATLSNGLYFVQLKGGLDTRGIAPFVLSR